MILKFKCSECDSLYDMYWDGRIKPHPESMHMICFNSQCAHYQTTRKCYRVNESTGESLDSAQDTELKNAIIEQINLWNDLACDYYRLPVKPLKIDFDLTGQVAGQAWGSYKIRINLHIAKSNREAYFKRTIPHEIAHIITTRLYGGRAKSHGVEWRAIMKVFNVESTRCHSYDTSGLNTGRRQYSFACVLCGEVYNVGKNLRNKIINGSTHCCRKCGVAGKLIAV